ncbi:EAL domain-containing protein [Reinekea blandensis]|uniref:Signalling protein containing EAL domain n=1 Tax=Reinekea blandensis MED297 TaxID=314283 RepID=A4BA97_9GAMM|nr:EAL domain-containing protein [Reinekea blandensis]EAR10853.1 Signalling protein containing EAL domain [Reinekea sp. MED297] [Reinekea blandensis MED297]
MAIAMAFQPIVNCRDHSIFAYEALVRGPKGESAGSILNQVTEGNKYSFDQACRVEAIKTMAGLDRSARLSINFLPNAIYNPNTCIQRTLSAAKQYQYDTSKLIFEVVEHEEPISQHKLSEIFTAYRAMGFTTAIDDFGAGYSGLNQLLDLKPDLIKLDRALVDGIDQNPDKKIVVKHLVAMLKDMRIQVLAEGVERREEYELLHQLGIDLMQGYYFARPLLGALPVVPESCW